MPEIPELVRSIDDRLAEARDEIAALEAALVSLSDHVRPTSTGQGTTRRKGRTSAPKPAPSPRSSSNSSAPEPQATQSPKPARKQRAKRAEVVSAAKLEKVLGASDGLATSAIAEEAGGDRDQVLALLRELEAAGKVRRTGQRRSTRWHLITEEDGIAVRATPSNH